MPTIDLEVTSLREFNQMLHDLGEGTNDTYFRVLNPRGRHAIAAGVDADVTIEIDGNAGYYCAGMNKRANVIINGSAGVGVAEHHERSSLRHEGRHVSDRAFDHDVDTAGRDAAAGRRIAVDE